MTMTNSSTHYKCDNGNNGNTITATMPPKPYAEYTIFFRLERTYILQSSGIIDEEVVASLDPKHRDPLEFPRPKKYERLALPPYWYSSSHKAAIEKKRKHRKRAGRMDLKTLSKTISASWRSADPSAVEYCRKLALAELKKYNELIGGIVRKQGSKATVTVPSTLSCGSTQRQEKQQQQQQQPSKDVVQFPDGTLSVQDLVLTQAKQVTTTANMPVANLSSVSGHLNNLRNSFNESMCYGENKRQDETFLVMLQLQAAQQNASRLCGNNSSPNSVQSCSPIVNGGGLLPTKKNPTSVQSSASAFKNNGECLLTGMSKKRKFVRQSSAPPEFTDHGLRNAFWGMNNANGNQISAIVGSNSDSAFLGEGNSNLPKQTRPRSSIASRGSQEKKVFEELHEPSVCSSNASLELKLMKGMQRTPSVARQELSESFQEELNKGLFTCVPKWEKQDVDTLLDILNDVPQASCKPTATNSGAVPLAISSRDIKNMFMGTLGAEQQIGDFGMEDICGFYP